MAVFGPINPEPQQHFLQGFLRAQEAEKMQLANAFARIQNKYAPKLNEAEVGLKKGQEYENYGRGKHYFAEADSAPFRNALLQSQAAHFNTLNKLAPEELQLKRDQLQHQQGRFGEAYQLARMLNSMPPAARAQWIGQNQEAYSGILQALGNGTAGSVNGNGNNTNALNTPPPTQAPMGQMPQGMGSPMMPPQNQSPFKAPSPQQINQLEQTNNMSANKALTTAASQRQMEGAIQVENIINDPMVQNQAVNAAQYAGAARKGKAALDAFSQKNPQAYEDYIAFKNQTMILLQNRIKTLDQMGATDKQREELQGLYSKTMDSLSSNPKQFITQFNKLGNTLDTIAKSVQKSASPVAPINRLEGFQPIPEAGSVNSSLSGMSDDELMRIAGGS